MQFNLFKNLRGQAKKMANTIKNLSPKVKPVEGYSNANAIQVSKGAIQKKFKNQELSKKNELLDARIRAILKDKASKEAIYKQQDDLSKEPIYNVLLDQFMEDAFGIDPDDKIVSVEVLDDDAELRELLEVFPKDFIERTHLDEILTDNIRPYFLKYGELFLKKLYTNGLVTGLEVMDGKYVYPICNGLGVIFYLVIDPITNDFEALDTQDILAFQLNPEVKTIVSGDTTLEAILREQSDELKALIPNSYKIGTPLLYNARNSLTKLRLASILTDLAQLKSLAMPTILATNIENIRDEEQLSELLDTYEEWAQDIMELPNLNDSSDLNLEEMATSAIKILPVEGSGKNGLSAIDLSNGTALDTSYLDKKKEDVALDAEFPISAVSVQSNENSKADLSSNRRYRNRCKSAQRFIVRPLHKCLLEDFEIQDIDISPSQLRVFCKPIVSLDTAEDLEVSLGAITQASQVYEQLLIIQDNSEKYTIDEDGYYDYFNTLLSPFKGAGKLLKEREPEVSNDNNDSENDIEPDTVVEPKPTFKPKVKDYTDIDTNLEQEALNPLESINDNTEIDSEEMDI